MKMKHNTGNVKEYPKEISLETNFRDILQKNDNAINFVEFFLFFFIFHTNYVKTFIIQFINNYPKDTC